MNKIRRFMGMFIISVCLLSVLSGCDLIDELRSETDVVDYNTTYGIGEGEYTITLNNEMMDVAAIDDGQGNVYMDANTANKKFNSRIYWQEMKMLFCMRRRKEWQSIHRIPPATGLEIPVNPAIFR